MLVLSMYIHFQVALHKSSKNLVIEFQKLATKFLDLFVPGVRRNIESAGVTMIGESDD